MKALLSLAPGGPETLVVQDLPDPVAGPGQLLIAVKACSVNFPDVLVIEDKYQFKPARPFAPGNDVSGIVEAIGEGVTGWKVGDRVIGSAGGSGGMAEKALMSAANTYTLPPERSFAEGASLLMTYGTTIHGLIDRGAIKEGDVMLVLGAAGGVGMSAVELGVAFGARVIAAVSSEEKAEACRKIGASDVVIYPRGPLDRDQQKALSEAFKKAVGPEGADIIYDIIGGDYAEPALRAIGWEGRYLVVGFTAGIPKLPLNLTLLKACDVRGLFWGAFTVREPDRNRDHIARLFRLWNDGKINPLVSETFPLERGGDAIAKMARREAIGKLVITME
jgi:NADPH:quinone reductase